MKSRISSSGSISTNAAEEQDQDISGSGPREYQQEACIANA